MIKILRSILSILVAAVAILFAIGNRGPVTVTLSPVHDAFEMPVFLLGLGGVLIGFLIGGAMVWLNDLSIRIDRRRQGKTIKKLEQQLEDKAHEVPAGTGSTAVMVQETGRKQRRG